MYAVFHVTVRAHLHVHLALHVHVLYMQFICFNLHVHV